MKKYYDNREDNIAFERWVDVTARLVLKYGPGLLKRLEKENMVLYMIDYEFCTYGAESDSFTNDRDVVLGYSYVVSAA